MPQQEKLDLKTFNDQPLPNTFFKQEKGTDHLAVLLPGRGYTAQMPLLFYPALQLRERGADVLRLDVNYSEREDFQALEMNEQFRHLFAEVAATYQAGLAQGNYRQITLVGKSLGTLAMGHLLTTETLPPVVNAIFAISLFSFVVVTLRRPSARVAAQ